MSDYLRRGLAVARERQCDPVDAMEAVWREDHPEGTASDRGTDQAYLSALHHLRAAANANRHGAFFAYWRESPEAALAAWEREVSR